MLDEAEGVTWTTVGQVTGKSRGRSFPNAGLPAHSGLVQEPETVRVRQYASSKEEEFISGRAVAAPIVDGFGNVCAAVTATGPTGHPIWKCPEDAIRCVKAAAREISRRWRG